MTAVYSNFFKIFVFAVATALLATTALMVCGADLPAGSYVLGPGDEISVWALGAEELSAHPIRLDPSGFIDLPIAGRIHAAGLTAEQLKSELSRRLASELRYPDRVTVTVTDYHSQPVSVMGAVNKPGVYQMQGPKTLLEVLSLAEGAKPDAGTTVRVTRRSDEEPLPLLSARKGVSGEVSTAEVSLQEVLEGNSAAANLMIRPHDVVTVSQAQTVYVMGDVRKQGGFAVGAKERISLLQAVTLSEGLKPTASPGNARILRSTGDGPERRQIPVNLKDVMAGKATDSFLQPEDILFIPDSKTKNVAIRAAEAALAVGSGIAIWRVGLR
jgi:polysaccharide export outer membrane protein